MSEKLASVISNAETYTRKKDNKPGLRIALVLEDNTSITVYGSVDDPILSNINQGEMVMVTKNGNFYNITQAMNSEGEFVAVERPKYSTESNTNQATAQAVFDAVDVEEVKKYIRWHSKILAYCYEQHPDRGDLIYQQACQKFKL